MTDLNASGSDLFQTVVAGDEIFHEGDAGKEMFIIESGRVEILRSIDGRERTLATLESGDFFGEMSLLEGQPRVATARAAVETRLLSISPDVFEDMVRSRPEVAVSMLRKLSSRMREATEAADNPRTSVQIEVPEFLRDQEPLPAVTERRLLHRESGKVFSLPAEGEWTVGRADPVTGRVPDVDLGSIDEYSSVSRRHAKIVCREGMVFVSEESKSANGTSVAGERLVAGAVRRAEVGDLLRFGGVTLRLEEAA